MTTTAENEQVSVARQLAARYLEETAAGACLTCSFQAEDVVVLHMLKQVAPRIPVVFLDTGYHFSETYEYRDRMTREWNLNLVNLLPEQSVAEQEAQFGILHQTDPSRCCSLRKVQPLFRELAKYRVWFTGLRREQAKTRSGLEEVGDFVLPSGQVLKKISPLAGWTTKDVWQYAEEHSIPLLSLYARGYTSIGCEPCTSLPWDPGDPRSGRWGGRKQECGIHVKAASS